MCSHANGGERTCSCSLACACMSVLVHVPLYTHALNVWNRCTSCRFSVCLSSHACLDEQMHVFCAQSCQCTFTLKIMHARRVRSSKRSSGAVSCTEGAARLMLTFPPGISVQEVEGQCAIPNAHNTTIQAYTGILRSLGPKLRLASRKARPPYQHFQSGQGLHPLLLIRRQGRPIVGAFCVCGVPKWHHRIRDGAVLDVRRRILNSGVGQTCG